MNWWAIGGALLALAILLAVFLAGCSPAEAQGWALVNTIVRPTHIGGPGQRTMDSVLGRYGSWHECEAARAQRTSRWLAEGGWRTYGNTIAMRTPSGGVITATLVCIEGR